MSKKVYVYIVDDDHDDREILRDAFISAGFNLDFILLESGDSLQQHLNDHMNEMPPALIMLDLNMPGKDGRETLKYIKSNKKYFQIPIIIFTTSSSPRDKSLAYDLGANCFITKPDTFSKLQELVVCIFKLWLG